MALEWINTIWDYNYWAHRKLWDCILTVSDADFERPVAYSIGSLHKQVVHTMWAEALWLSRILGAEYPTFTVEDYPTRESIRNQWDAVETDWRGYLANLTQDDLSKSFDYTRANGEHVTNILQEVLWHIVNHGTDQRAQMLQLIYSYGGETFEQDMFFYYRERDGIETR